MVNNNQVLDRWSKEKSLELYNIKNWSQKYFSVNNKGEITVNPFRRDDESAVSLVEIINDLKDGGIDAPVLLRFENILDSQITYINDTFNKAIKTLNYKGSYKGVYPIKVNQQQQVVEEVAKFGRKYHHGLEVGSKAELIAALSAMKDTEASIICNGYKDSEFIDLGLYATKMGYKCFFVIEMQGELDIILDHAKEIGVEPNIGVRIKLSSTAGGHWSESSGDRSIFGLSTTQLIDIVDKLKESNMISCLKLLHYHLGSQVPNIRDIRSAVQEAARVYAELFKEGAPMGYLDLGGGLAVDYDGSQTNYASSRNYTVDEYCMDIIEAVMNTMDKNDVPHPTITTESGRALVAYYSVLIFNVLEVAEFEKYQMPAESEINEDTNETIKNLHEVSLSITQKNIQECYNDALYYRDQIREMFKHGRITLRERALAEKIFWNIINDVARTKKKIRIAPEELENIESVIADIYYCNFSVFQSLPDSWAIDQLFPIVPLQRLNECPASNAVIADITCDCDGKIDNFIDSHDIRKTLPVHKIKHDEDYYIGAFLVGAYQETLGDLHNLFGDTNVVSIKISKEGNYEIVNEIQGDTVADVLSYVEFEPKQMRRNFRVSAEKAVKEGRINPSEHRKIMDAFDTGLAGYTYYEKE